MNESDIEIEAGLLGTIVVDAGYNSTRCLDLAKVGGISAADFRDPELAAIYETMVVLSNDPKGVIDQHLIIERLKSLNKDSSVNRLEDLIAKSGTTAHCESYIGKFKEIKLKRKLSDLAYRMAKDAASSVSYMDGSTCFFKYMGEMMALEVKNAAESSYKEDVEEVKNSLIKLIDEGFTLEDGLLTGFRGLDELMNGMRPGQMIVLAARPSVGKTSLAMNIARNVTRSQMSDGSPLTFHQTPMTSEKAGVLVFSQEMSAKELIRRILIGDSGLNVLNAGAKIMMPTQCAAKREAVISAAERAKADPIKIVNIEGSDVMDLWARARREIAESHREGHTPIKLIVIDYLQLLTSRVSRGEGTQFELSDISGKIKRMALELNVPVLVLSQLSRESEKSTDKDHKPKLSDLRGSGAIEQDADIVILLWRAAMIENLKGTIRANEVEANIAKNRNGRIGAVPLTFDGNSTRFQDPKPEEDL